MIKGKYPCLLINDSTERKVLSSIQTQKESVSNIGVQIQLIHNYKVINHMHISKTTFEKMKVYKEQCT